MSTLPEITNDQFEQNVLIPSKTRRILVDFWAPWCGPCKRLTPQLETLQTTLGDTATIVKVNAETETDLIAKYGIRAVPSLLVFKDGEVIERLVGLQSNEVIQRSLTV